MLVCKEENRKQKVIEENSSGMDYVEIIPEKGKDTPSLCVHFFGKIPEGIKESNLRIEGGRRIKDIKVTSVRYPPKIKSHEKKIKPEQRRCLLVKLDKQGDFSNYILKIVEAEEPDKPLNLLDPRYAQVEFSFKAGCPTDLDCKSRQVCHKPDRNEPEIGYLAKDYASFRQLILDRLALIMPEWSEQHIPDLDLALVEVMAYQADHLSYYQDAVATEAYLNTARQRVSVKRHVSLIDYQMHEGCNARALVSLETDTDLSLYPEDFYFITGNVDSSGSRVLSHQDLQRTIPQNYEIFEPLLSRAEGFSKEDIKDPLGIMSRLGMGILLTNYENPIFRYFGVRLSDSVQDSLLEFVLEVLTKGLNSMLKDGEIYDELAFAKTKLSKETKKLLMDHPMGDNLVKLNKMLLEEAFPDYLNKGNGQLFSPLDIEEDYGEFLSKLRSGIGQESFEDPIYVYIGERLSYYSQCLFDDLVLELFLNCFNALIEQEDLYQEQVFAGVNLRNETREAIRGKLKTKDCIRLKNRMLLEDAYPDHLQKFIDGLSNNSDLKFGKEDLKDPFCFLGVLRLGLSQEGLVDEVSRYIVMRFPSRGQNLLKNLPPISSSLNSFENTLPENLREALIKELNRLTQGGWLFDDIAFDKIKLREETKRLKAEKPQGRDLIKLNRLLMEDAFSEYFRRNDEIRLSDPIIASGSILGGTWSAASPKGLQMPP
jgi:hypothetical protein